MSMLTIASADVSTTFHRVFCHKNQFENDSSAYYSSYTFHHLSCNLKFCVGSNRAYQIPELLLLIKVHRSIQV